MVAILIHRPCPPARTRAQSCMGCSSVSTPAPGQRGAPAWIKVCGRAAPSEQTPTAHAIPTTRTHTLAQTVDSFGDSGDRARGARIRGGCGFAHWPLCKGDAIRTMSMAGYGSTRGRRRGRRGSAYRGFVPAAAVAWTSRRRCGPPADNVQRASTAIVAFLGKGQCEWAADLLSPARARRGVLVAATPYFPSGIIWASCLRCPTAAATLSRERDVHSRRLAKAASTDRHGPLPWVASAAFSPFPADNAGWLGNQTSRHAGGPTFRPPPGDGAAQECSQSSHGRAAPAASHFLFIQ